jgi:hypothetical protein
VSAMKELDIYLEKTIYQPGEFIKGTIIFRLDKELKVRDVVFTIIGEEETRIHVQSGKHGHTYTDTFPIMQINRTVFGEGVLQPDEYRSDFSFQIPNTAPATYYGKNTKVTYKIKAHADVPLWFDVKTKKGFMILWNPELVRQMAKPITFATVNFEDYPDLELSQRYRAGFGKPKPSFYVELDRNTYLAGDEITGRITVKNPTNKRLRKVDVLLRAKEFATAAGYARNITVEKHKSRIDFDNINEGVPTPFSIPIPRNVRSSFCGNISRLNWYLEMNLDVAFAFDVKADTELAIYQWQG